MHIAQSLGYLEWFSAALLRSLSQGLKNILMRFATYLSLDLTVRHNIVDEINNYYSYSLFAVYLQPDGVWKGERQPAHRGLHHPGRQQIQAFLIPNKCGFFILTFLRGIIGGLHYAPPNTDYVYYM
jgi:hypothetical protein